MTLWLTKVGCVLAGSRKLKTHRVLLKSQWYKRTLRNFFDGSFKTTDDGYPFLVVFFNILIPFQLLNDAIDCKQFILGHFSSICLSFQSNKHIQRFTAMLGPQINNSLAFSSFISNNSGSSSWSIMSLPFLFPYNRPDRSDYWRSWTEAVTIAARRLHGN